MARDQDDSRKRQREREREDERDAEERAIRQARASGVSASEANKIVGDKFTELILRVEPMMEQLNNLYNMFVSGMEKVAPIEKRKQLDQMMLNIQNMPKYNPSQLFKSNNIHSKYVSYRDRWDKLMRDLEDGKIKRAIGVRR
jgi:hypothetical protein